MWSYRDQAVILPVDLRQTRVEYHLESLLAIYTLLACLLADDVNLYRTYMLLPTCVLGSVSTLPKVRAVNIRTHNVFFA